MALKITQSATFWWPVDVLLPAADGGQMEKHSFEVEFARMKVSEAEKMVAGIATGAIGQLDGYRQMVKGWRGVVSGGDELPFSDEALRSVIDIPAVGPAILAAYQLAVSGQARTKN